MVVTPINFPLGLIVGRFKKFNLVTKGFHQENKNATLLITVLTHLSNVERHFPFFPSALHLLKHNAFTQLNKSLSLLSSFPSKVKHCQIPYSPFTFLPPKSFHPTRLVLMSGPE